MGPAFGTALNIRRETSHRLFVQRTGVVSHLSKVYGDTGCPTVQQAAGRTLSPLRLAFGRHSLTRRDSDMSAGR